jgi:hypothetical protein
MEFSEIMPAWQDDNLKLLKHSVDACRSKHEHWMT